MARYEPVRAKPVGRVARWLLRARRKPKVVAVVGTLLLLGVGLLAFAIMAANRGDRIDVLEAKNIIEAARESFWAGDFAAVHDGLDSLADTKFGEVYDAALALRADLAFHRGDHAIAASLFGEACVRVPTSRANHVGRELVSGQRQNRAVHVVEDLPSPVDARDAYYDGLLYLQAGEIDRCFQRLEDAFALKSTSYFLGIELATRACEHMRRSVSEITLRRLQFMRPGDMALLCDLADVLYGSDWEACRDLLQNARLQFGDRVDLCLREARVRARYGREVSKAHRILDRALVWIEEAAQWTPAARALALRRVRACRVHVHVINRNYDRAKRMLEQLLADSGRFETSAEFVIACAEYGRMSGTAEWIERALRASSKIDFYGLPAERAWWRSELARLRKDRSEQRKWVEQAIEEDPENARFRGEFAGLLIAAGEHAQARALLDEAIRMQPRQARLRELSGICEERMGRPWGAIQEFTVSHVLDPTWANTAALLARLWAELGSTKAAVHWGRKAVGLDENSINAWVGLAWAERSAKQYGAAAISLERALKLHPVPALRSDFAEALHMSGDEARAIEQYALARRDDPKLASAYCGEAVIRLDAKDLALRDAGLASRLMRRAIELDPDATDYAGYLERAERLVLKK